MLRLRFVPQMRYIVLTALIAVFVFASPMFERKSQARWRLFGGRSVASSSVASSTSYSRGGYSRGGHSHIAGSPGQVAAYKANVMASQCRMRHIGGGYGGANAEGVGMASTPGAALANCCFTGRRPLVASAVRRGSNGMFYAIKLFR